MLILQACKGTEFDMGIQVPDTNPFGGEYGPAPGAAPTKVSEYGDLMVAYSTIPGFVSFRDPTNGSWFIQDLCEVNNKLFIMCIEHSKSLSRCS